MSKAITIKPIHWTTKLSPTLGKCKWYWALWFSQSPQIHKVHDHGGYGTLTWYVKLRFAHASGMPGTFSPPPRVSDLDVHHGTCVTHVPWCMLGSLTSGFLWSRGRGKHSRHSRRMHNPHFYVSDKRLMKWSTHQSDKVLIKDVNWYQPSKNRYLPQMPIQMVHKILAKLQ